MKIWIGITDKDWFRHLLARRPDEVNFWQPSGSREFRVLQPGEPFLFKLHAPDHFIVGGGFFVRYSALPTSVAWEAFEQKNGVANLVELRERVRRYRRREAELDPVIGCNILANPFFLDREDWIPAPADWASNIVTGKTFSTETVAGQTIWQQVTQAISAQPRVGQQDLPAVNMERRFGEEFLTRGRLGQGAFRILVTEAYERRCAISGEKTVPVLEAAHIRPYASEGPHQICNGLLLRSDIHKLFDLGYVTVTPELRVEVSPRLRADYSNGREYYAHHGRELASRPVKNAFQPGREFLRWHNDEVFKS